MSDDQHLYERQAVELWRMGVAVDEIAEKTRLTKRRIMTLVRRTLDQAMDQSADDIRRAVLDQLIRLQQVVWPAAMRGDLKAIERVQALLQDRMRVAQMIDRDSMQTPMSDAYDKTIAALHLSDADAALVQTGRRIAARMDSAAMALDPTVETKALYLTPHLQSILKDLGATPSARAGVTGAERSSPTSSVLDRFQHGNFTVVNGEG